MRRILIALCLLCSCSVWADDLLGQIQKQLADTPVQRGEFVQTRELVGVKRPLKSEGRFVVDKARGVIWKSEKPFTSLLRVGRQEIVQKEGSNVLMRISADKEPAVKTIGTVLFSLFSGDLATLATYFEYQGQVSGKRWQVVLTPRDAGFAKLVRSIHMQGGRNAEVVLLTGASGDTTRIEMRNVSGADKLIPAEAADFE